jgi:hypothetical protein
MTNTLRFALAEFVSAMQKWHGRQDITDVSIKVLDALRDEPAEDAATPSAPAGGADLSAVEKERDRLQRERDTAKANARYMLELKKRSDSNEADMLHRATVAEDRCRALVKALKKLAKIAKRFQLEEYEEKRRGRLWDDLYHAIEKAESVALAPFEGKGETP